MFLWGKTSKHQNKETSKQIKHNQTKKIKKQSFKIILTELGGLEEEF